MLSLILVKKIASLLLVMLLGFMSVRIGVLKTEDSKVLSKMCVYFIVPCMILNAFQVDRTPEVTGGFMLALLMSIIVQAVFIAVTTALRKPLDLKRVEQGSIEYSNAGNVVIPMVTAMFGSGYVIYSLAYVCSTTILLWSHLFSIMSNGKKIDIRKILTNVNLIAIFVSFILFLLNIRFPDFIKDSLQSVSDTIGPVSMFLTGMLLGGQNLRNVFLKARTYFIAAGRLVVMPLLSLAIYKLLGTEGWIADGEKIMLVSFLGGITCSGATVTQMADLFTPDGEYAASINVVTTVLSIITVPAMIYLFQLF